MGVSSQNGNPDLDAAMAGGSSFEKRLAELASAKASLEQAYTDLGVGKAANLAYDEASKLKSEAAAELASAKEQAANIVNKAKADGDSLIKSAADQAERIKLDAQQAAEAKLAEIAEMRAKAKADADEAEKAKADAKKLKADLAKEMADQKSVTDAANKAFDAHASASAQLKALREKVLASLKELENVNV